MTRQVWILFATAIFGFFVMHSEWRWGVCVLWPYFYSGSSIARILCSTNGMHFTLLADITFFWPKIWGKIDKVASGHISWELSFPESSSSECHPKKRNLLAFLSVIYDYAVIGTLYVACTIVAAQMRMAANDLRKTVSTTVIFWSSGPLAKDMTMMGIIMQ